MEEHLKLVIVGHVDHGKSTLIGRLLYDTDSLPEGKLDEVKATCDALGHELEFAFVMDHLQEEREQGITIDTTQTFFKTEKRNYVIIDAPGHVEFIKNMITGASQAEAAILIVDANEGVQEQTRRHAYVLRLLGIDQVIVILNKMDLANYSSNRYEEVKSKLLEFLKTLGIAPFYVIPISAKDGANVANRASKIGWYEGPTVLEALDTFKTASTPIEKALRFPIQDIYKIGDKRLLVGRIESGKLIRGQTITFSPTGSTAIVKSIDLFGDTKEAAEAGESIGITLERPSFIERGEVASSSNTPTVTTEFKANVFWMDKKEFSGEKLYLRCATQEVSCELIINQRLNSSTLELIEDDARYLGANEVGRVVVKTTKPMCVDAFNSIQELGRFILVRDNDVVAGGIVT